VASVPTITSHADGHFSGYEKVTDKNLCLFNANSFSAESQRAQEAIKRTKSYLVHIVVAKRLRPSTNLKLCIGE